jgi:hypothetical protein
MKADPKPRAFVFFTNVDLTPAEVEELTSWGVAQGLSFVDFYWRERIRQVLDSPEGLAIRHQYLGMNMSEAEQASFFSRFGNDLERLMQGRLDTIERKIDGFEFGQWKAGTIRELSLELRFKQYEDSSRQRQEHFRVFLELQSVCGEHRSIALGGRDSFWPNGKGGWYFGTRTFFWRESVPQSGSVWIPPGVLVGGGIIGSIHFRPQWRPRSPILAEEFRGLSFHLHLTENIIARLASVEFSIDKYVFVRRRLDEARWENARPTLAWPERLSKEEEAVEWRMLEHFGWLDLERAPSKRDHGD